MKKFLVTSVGFMALAICTGPNAFAQGDSKAKVVTAGVTAPPAAAITATTSPLDLARAALAAQGGEKYKAIKNIILRGSVDLYAPNSTQSIPGGFLTVIAGDKLRSEVDARPAISFKQIYDGQQSYSSLPGVDLPPITKLGMGLLLKYDQAGVTVSAIPDKKKLRGFRIVDSEGHATDFYVDATNGRLMSYNIPYGGYNFATEIKKFKEVEGALIPVNFTQRLEMPQGAFFADYNVKDIKLNSALGDDVFAIPS